MTSPPVTFDRHSARRCSDKYCRLHYYWDFNLENHIRLPNAWRFLTSSFGWVESTVFVGPPAWLPRKPTPAQIDDMTMTCPHQQMDLTCNTCLRHTFRPMEM